MTDPTGAATTCGIPPAVLPPDAGTPAAAMTAGRTAETAPAEADPVEAARAENALAIVRGLARTQHLPAELNAVLDGLLAGAVSVAADYASGAISEATRAAYRGDWTEFAAWRRTQHVDPTALPIHPVLVAAPCWSPPASPGWPENRPQRATP